MNFASDDLPTGWLLLWGRRVAAGSILLLLAACSRDSTPNRAGATRPRLSNADIARIGDAVISRQAFEQEWQRYTDGRSKENLLQEMIRFEALLAKARSAGVDRDPELLAAFKRMVVGKFQEDQLLRRGLESIDVNEAEIQAHYKNRPERFITPAQLRLGVIFCKASAKAASEARGQLRQKAEALWNVAKQATDAGFRELARQRSDDQATRYGGGDTGWFVPEQSNARWESEVIQAALALRQPGDVAPLLETRSGFYVVKLLGTQPASRHPLTEVRDGIEYQLRRAQAQKVREAFFEEMQAGLAVEINRSALDAIPDRVMQVKASAPPALPK